MLQLGNKTYNITIDEKQMEGVANQVKKYLRKLVVDSWKDEKNEHLLFTQLIWHLNIYIVIDTGVELIQKLLF